MHDVPFVVKFEIMDHVPFLKTNGYISDEFWLHGYVEVIFVAIAAFDKMLM